MKFPWLVSQSELNQLVITSPKIPFESYEFSITMSHSNSNNSPFDFALKCHSKIDVPFRIIANISVVHPKGPAYSSVIAIPAQFSKIINKVVIQTNMYLNLLTDCKFFSKNCVTFEIEISYPPIYDKSVIPLVSILDKQKLYTNILDESYLLSQEEKDWIYSASFSIFNSEPSIIHVKTSLIIISNVKDIASLENIFKKYGNPQVAKYLVITNFSNTKLLHFCLLLKCMFPENFVLIRQKITNPEQSGYSQQQIDALLNQIPFAAIIDDSVFVIAGGLVPSPNFIDEIEKNDFNRLDTINKSLDSHPDPDIEWYQENSGICFGKLAAEAFLKKYNYDLLICTGNLQSFWPFGFETNFVQIKHGFTMFIDSTHEYCFEQVPE
ncbi:hypothetical protein TVAG_092150 [Trichomonas vaginalis G3]|uniref:protein-serine/threonine phosphatase n=1 Tax=Trichomonas vaginalis (strain ATCC PRA-98 / G3) TaxID=412133 RepID=A2FWH2_TRIV3|nr:phosphoprotein phosphatase protein [Trichomonas vaginalis G3]EAX90742.1 hypothetical protein TVAG_092150 [Trichomonas vaginalis G3]KAI5515761.1 phosphoprotein phosphatase protein [Trichomonas vaginalis G3]|eukprot:XP_001303672.1 hypothetical protein [Trichomonas vaginalis G3]